MSANGFLPPKTLFSQAGNKEGEKFNKSTSQLFNKSPYRTITPRAKSNTPEIFYPPSSNSLFALLSSKFEKRRKSPKKFGSTARKPIILTSPASPEKKNEITLFLKRKKKRFGLSCSLRFFDHEIPTIDLRSLDKGGRRMVGRDRSVIKTKRAGRRNPFRGKYPEEFLRFGDFF